jgi:bacterial/archaeal transporter family-2 protein
MPAKPRPADLALAFVTGGLLTLMVLFNGTMGAATTPFFSSLVAHGTGTIAALIVLAALFARRGRRLAGRPGVAAAPAPWWSFLGGLSGALTVVLTSVTMGSPLALTGTLALGLAGQLIFGLAADRWGLFGLPARRPDRRDAGAVALVAAGSLIIIFQGAFPWS